MANNVQFDEPGMQYARGPRGPRMSALTKIVIRAGLAKDARQAAFVLIAIGVVAAILAFVFWPRENTELPPVPQPVAFTTS